MVKFAAGQFQRAIERIIKRDWLSLGLCFGLVLANGCHRFDSSSQAIQISLNGRESLRVASLKHSRLQRQYGNRTKWGLSYDLLQNLTTTAKLKLEWQIVDNETLGEKLLQDGKIDLLVSRNSLPLVDGLQFGPSPAKDLFFFIGSKDEQLLKALYIWNQQISKNGFRSESLALYPRENEVLTSTDFKLFKDSINHTLPTYLKAFKKYSAEVSQPWQLAAAIAFQESHWDANARSYTGVRGMMMLTEETAALVKVTDRRDPDQSIRGGTKYIHLLMNLVEQKSLGETPTYREKVALTLAAYNIGFGHIEDAQLIAKKLGRDPSSWLSLKEILPMLENPAWASQTKWGAARGSETVSFVERTLAYFDLL